MNREKRKKVMVIFILWLLGLSVCSAVAGYLIHDLVNPEYAESRFMGCWASVTGEVENNGDWVCVNVRDMSFEKAVEVCNHEVGHEIFAHVCEKNITKCLEVGK